ncbi:hypothetical protein KP509_25G056600 [Ceratopteris richardii]|uniref:Uncharacterized protein n=1 Tax=Ceratopteris richardii TaxID=49495 RepID=A0A8T2RSV3_CERRI|nr:hypothetical protein KP509_25G056600 [Ceratopteris richardii]
MDHSRHPQVLNVHPSPILRTLALVVAIFSSTVECRKVPTSPLSEEEAELLVISKAKAFAEQTAVPKVNNEQQLFKSFPPSESFAKEVSARTWRLRALWVSVIGKDPAEMHQLGSSSKATRLARVSFHPTGMKSPSIDALTEAARQVPGGPDPLHHEEEPSP